MRYFSIFLVILYLVLLIWSVSSRIKWNRKIRDVQMAAQNVRETMYGIFEKFGYKENKEDNLKDIIVNRINELLNKPEIKYGLTKDTSELDNESLITIFEIAIAQNTIFDLCKDGENKEAGDEITVYEAIMDGENILIKPKT